jgi:hypothetical protein
MMNSVQLALADPGYAVALREALARSGPWNVVSAERADPCQKGVLVLDEDALNRLALPLLNPERVVLVTRKDPAHLSEAWEAGIVSVVSDTDPPSTVVLAIMAAALRVPKAHAAVVNGGAISPTGPSGPASISPESHHHFHKRCKNQ